MPQALQYFPSDFVRSVFTTGGRSPHGQAQHYRRLTRHNPYYLVRRL